MTIIAAVFGSCSIASAIAGDSFHGFIFAVAGGLWAGVAVFIPKGGDS